MVAVNSSGLTKALMKVISSRTIFMEKVSTDGPMDVSITVSGSITKWRDREPSPGAMVVAMSVAIKMIRSMVMAPSNGPMVANTSANGAKANSMVKVSISKKAKNVKESGKWAKELNGLRLRHREPTDKVQFFSSCYNKY